MKIKFKYTYYVAFFILLIVSSCKHNNSESSFFRFNINSNLTTLDPAFAKDQGIGWCTSQLYNGLLQLDDSLQIQPCIAKNWEISRDDLTYTFYLRNDILFHQHAIFDGRKRYVTAHDVKYSLDRIIDKNVASPGAWIFNEHVADSAFTVINDSIFQIKLRHAFRPLLGILTMSYCYIIPHEAIAYYGASFRKNPIGTGPFQFVAWKENEVLLMKRNPDYWEQDSIGHSLPYIEGLRVSFMDSKAAEFLEFSQGNLDFLNAIDPSYKDLILDINGTIHPSFINKATLIRGNYLMTEYFGFMLDENAAYTPVQKMMNKKLLEFIKHKGIFLSKKKTFVKNEILQNKKIRQAINYAIDRESIIAHFRNNIGIPAHGGMIPKGLAAYDTNYIKGYYYNPDKAIQLLRESKYNKEPITLYTNPSYSEIGIYVIQLLRNIGFNAQLEILPPAFLREMMAKRSCTFFRGAWIADYPDEESYMAMFYSKNGSPPNYTRFKNEEFDKLYKKVLNEHNDSIRIALYRKMDQIIIDEAAIVPLYYDNVIRFCNRRVTGLTINPLNNLDLRKIKIEK